MRTDRAACAALALLAACAERATPPPPARDDAAAPVAVVREYVPYVAGDFARVYVPPGDVDVGEARYLNDHTLVRAPDGTWHLYGITFTGKGSPFLEHSFLHATAPSLAGPWTDRDDAITADPRFDEGCCVWAPHVVSVGPSRWVMFYYAEGGGLRRAVSSDLETFTRVRTDAVDALRPPGGRDPFVFFDGAQWTLYSVGADAATATGQIVASVLLDGEPDTSDVWSRPTEPVTQDPVPNYPWGNLESPTVVRYGGAYYLFATRTADNDSDYTRTVVLRSRDPMRFAWEPVTELRAHAAEVLDVDGQWFITSAGWPGYIGEQHRGLSIARLAWAEVP